MNETLLKQFLSEECTQYVHGLLQTALDEWENSEAPQRKVFEFNRFEITIDFEEEIVVLEDDLDPTDVGIQKIAIRDFSTAISQKTF